MEAAAAHDPEAVSASPVGAPSPLHRVRRVRRVRGVRGVRGVRQVRQVRQVRRVPRDRAVPVAAADEAEDFNREARRPTWSAATGTSTH